MRTFEPGDIVRAPFPYTDRDANQHRPAIVVSTHGLGPKAGIFWVVMVTSAENRSWPHDVPIGPDHLRYSLPIPSVIRPAKIAAVDGARLEFVGRVSEDLLSQVVVELAAIGLGDS